MIRAGAAVRFIQSESILSRGAGQNFSARVFIGSRIIIPDQKLTWVGPPVSDIVRAGSVFISTSAAEGEHECERVKILGQVSAGGLSSCPGRECFRARRPG